MTSIQVDLIGATTLTGNATATVLTAFSALHENPLEEPTNVSPKTEITAIKG